MAEESLVKAMKEREKGSKNKEKNKGKDIR